jgi:hypothetical protein
MFSGPRRTVGTMGHRVTFVLVAAATMFLGTAGVGSASTTTALIVPASTAFSMLGHSCGGIQEQAFATAFDATSGYPTGDVHLQTRCGGSGRGGGYHSTTYAMWVGVTWDFTGAVVSAVVLSTAPTNIDPAFSAFDASGNQIYNLSNSAYLSLSPTFVPAPRVTGVSLTSGPAAGGTSLTITGTGFTGATAVNFGTTFASFTVNSDTSIVAVSPAAVADTVDVTVTSPGGASATSASDQFMFVAAPSVSSVSPDSGPVDGGTTVTIAGSNFTDATAVSFGDTPAGFTVNDDTSITAVSPVAEAAGTVAVTVATIGGTSTSSSADRFTYSTVVSPFAPTITKVTPNFGPPAGGSSVTITGTNFLGATDVAFGTTPVGSFTMKSDTSITTTAPSGVDTVDVRVTNAFGSSAITSTDEFSYGPRLTKIAPASGSAGGNTKVTISGHNFGGTTDVVFGSASALSFKVNATGTSITAMTPPEAGSGIQSADVTVTNAQGTSPITPADVFGYVTPVVSSAAPASGSAGGNTKVTIKGHNFTGATDVTFGGVSASSVTVNATGTTLTAVTPPEADSGVESVDVSVTTSAGTGTLTAAFTYLAPTVTKITPASGPVGGGTTVTIHGVNLYGASAVTFGSTPAPITKMTNTSLTVISPPGTGTVHVTVTNPAGTNPTSSLDQFTY